MDDLGAIPAIATWETAKAKRSARKGKLTRLTKRLEDFCQEPLHAQQTFTITKLRDDLQKEKRLHSALQNRCEQLMEEREEVTEDQMAREIEAGEEADELYTETLHRAEKAHVAISDPAVGEYEKDCSKLQRRFSAYLTQVASYDHPDIRNIHQRFIKYDCDVAARLNNSRGIRKKSKEEAAIIPSVATHSPKSSTLKLELPDFTGHPLDWHHFSQLFTSALDRAGSEFSDRERTCFLLKAMKTPEAERIVKSYAGYNKALGALVQRFSAPKKVFPHLVPKMT